MPPLLTFDEVCGHCYDAIGATNDMKEIVLILDVLGFEKKDPERALVSFLLTPLSELHKGDKVFELRKWRAIMLSEVLGKLQGDALNDSLEIGEFWAYYKYPPENPMNHPDIDNMRPEEYGSKKYLDRVVAANKEWLRKEMLALNHLQPVK